MKTLFAITEPKGTFPAYVDITELSDGAVKIAVRNRRSCLPSEMILSKSEFATMRTALATKPK